MILLDRLDQTPTPYSVGQVKIRDTRHVEDSIKERRYLHPELVITGDHVPSSILKIHHALDWHWLT